jgi:hypothetical protein
MPVPADNAPAEEEIEIDDSAILMRTVAGRPRPDGAPPVLPRSVPPHGDLATLPIPRLIFELYVSTYSGRVHLKRKEMKRVLYFWAGLPVRVDSELLAETLGALLREAGRITEEQCDLAQRLSVHRKIPLGAALVEMGVIREGELLAALGEQTERKLINTFAWRDGTFRLEEDHEFGKNTVLTEIPPLRVIWRGVHEQYELAALMSFFAKHKNRYVVATDLFAVQLETLGVYLRDLDMAPLLDGKTTFEAALRSNDEKALEIAQVLYTMLVTDMVEPRAEPGEPAPMGSAARPAAAPVTPVNYRHLMEVADRISGEYLQIKGKSHLEVLGLAPSATTGEIEEAAREALARVDKWLRMPGLPHEEQKRAREIGEIIARAREAVRHPQAHATTAAPLPTQRPTADGDVGLSGDDPARAAKRREALFAGEQYYKEGVRLLEALDPRGARAQFELASQSNPTEPTYRVAIAQAVLLAQKGAPDHGQAEAFVFIEDALRHDPGHLLANLEAARLLVKSGMKEQARLHLERVLKRAPHHQLARKLLDELGG